MNEINNLIGEILDNLYRLDDLTDEKEAVIMGAAIDLYDLRTKLNKEVTK